MNIALIGFGKMGHEIDSIAREQGDTIVRVFDSRHAVRPEALAGVDICFEFSTPEAVVSNIRAAIEALGGKLEHVIRTRMYVTDVTKWEEVAGVHGSVFKEIRPATTIVEVAFFVSSNALPN